MKKLRTDLKTAVRQVDREREKNRLAVASFEAESQEMDAVNKQLALVSK